MAAIEEPFENKPLKRRSAFISWKLLAVVLALLVAVVVAIAITYKRRSPLEVGTSALIDAFSKRRLIEPRLSGGFKGGEFRPSRDDASGIGSADLDRARRLILDAVGRHDPGADAAYARLLLSEGEKLDEARKYLRLALASQPESAEVHNDLGVCLIQQGKIEDAIVAFEAALKYQADLPEALFNRALCFQRLLLRDAASEGYEQLLKNERQASWRKEIKQRQKEVSAPLAPSKLNAEIIAAFETALANGKADEAKRIASQNIEGITKHAAYDSSIEYLTEAVAGNTKQAEAALFKIELIGREFIEAKGDNSIADLARYLRDLPDDQRQSEITLIGDYIEAEKLFNVQKYSGLQPTLERLEKSFAERENHLFEFFSIYCEAGCNLVSVHLELSRDTYNRALAGIEKRTWPYREALTFMQLGIVHSRLGQDSEAVKDCEKALQLGQGLCFLEAKTLQFLGNPYGNMGDVDKALAALRESTRLYLTRGPSLKDIASNYLDIADLYRVRGDHSLAVLYAKQSLRYARQDSDANRAAQALAFTAVEHARVKQADQAEEQLRSAFDYLDSTDSSLKVFTKAFVLTHAGEMAAECDESARAVDYYSRAVELLETSEGNDLPLIEALRGRAEAHTQAGDFDSARQDLERAVGLIEHYREKITLGRDRSNFLDVRQSVYDQLIQLNINAFGRNAEAFDFSEQSHARTLLDDFSPSEGDAVGSALQSPEKPLKFADVKKALPEDMRLLAYSVTSERTYIFLITRAGIEVAQSSATTEILDRLVQDYVSGLRTKAPLDEIFEKGAKLYEYLIEPIKGKLADGKRLCIVPDKALHFLPFQALVDPLKRYLLYYHITYAPSASVFVRCRQESREKGTSKDEKILAVGNPKFNRDRFPLLGNLRDAEDEASELAALYAHRTVLIGKDATESDVVAALKECDVAHLAVHCLVDEGSPWLAALVLAGSNQENAIIAQSSPLNPSMNDGMLYLSEVRGFTLPRTRLVVLSACQSGLGQYYRGEGIVSLVRPFLALRVPMVVASLWAINSQATSSLMIEFHRNRKAAHVNMEAGEALRLAQSKMAASGPYQHPFYWAPFVAVGSSN